MVKLKIISTRSKFNMDRVNLFNNIFNDDELQEIIKNYDINDVYEFFKTEFESLRKRDHLEKIKNENLKLIKKNITLQKYLTQYNTCNITKYYYINDAIQQINETDTDKIKDDYVRLMKNNKILDELINYIFFENKSNNIKKYNINITLDKQYNIIKKLDKQIFESIKIILKEDNPFYNYADEEYYVKEILDLRLECLVKIKIIENN